MTSVVLVDDEALMRDGLRLILELAGHTVVGEAADGDEAVAVILRTTPEVALMDVRMPVADGIEAMRQLQRAESSTRVVMLTTFDVDRHVYDALRAGAAGYMLKDSGREEILRAVDSAAAGETPVSGQVLRRLVARFTEHPPPGDRGSRLDSLSSREVEVLSLVGQGLSNDEIAARLVISVATAKSHVRHILAKLDLRDRVQAVVLAHECGLVATATSGG